MKRCGIVYHLDGDTVSLTVIEVVTLVLTETVETSVPGEELGLGNTVLGGEIFTSVVGRINGSILGTSRDDVLDSVGGSVGGGGAPRISGLGLLGVGGGAGSLGGAGNLLGGGGSSLLGGNGSTGLLGSGNLLLSQSQLGTGEVLGLVEPVSLVDSGGDLDTVLLTFGQSRAVNTVEDVQLDKVLEVNVGDLGNGFASVTELG